MKMVIRLEKRKPAETDSGATGHLVLIEFANSKHRARFWRRQVQFVQ